MTNTKANKESYLNHVRETFSDSPIKRKDLKAFNDKHGYKNLNWFYKDPTYQVSRGYYTVDAKESTIPEVPEVSSSIESDSSIENKSVLQNFSHTTEQTSMVPDVDSGFVSHGHFSLLHSIIKSKKFYPIFVTGLSGNGKTFSIEQACAKSKRELYRVNITIETDEDDLLGGFRLVNGTTKWFDGPVVRAMKSGGVLLLDEVDLGSNKLLCLQPVLEGKGILLKKINQFVKPKDGFTIVATANTKGQGSESGKFIGTNILNEAFLERFCATFEQEYPTEAVETKILKSIFSSNDMKDEHIDDFIFKLVAWANGTRKTYDSGGINDLISTRRLVHISNAYAILGHPEKADTQSDSEYKVSLYNVRSQAIQMCIARFDDYTKSSFIEFYDAIDQYKTASDENSISETEQSSVVPDVV